MRWAAQLFARIWHSLDARQSPPKLQLSADAEGVWLSATAFDRAPLFRWDGVKRIKTYKRDLYILDLIVLAFETEHGWIVVDEEQPGWSQVVEEMARTFPTVPPAWFGDVMLPPFAANERTLYERGRDQEALGAGTGSRGSG